MTKANDIITGLRLISALLWIWLFSALDYVVHGQIHAYPRLLWGRVVIALLLSITMMPKRLLMRSRLLYWGCLSVASTTFCAACIVILSGIPSELCKPSYDTLDAVLKMVVPIVGVLCVGCLPAALLMMRVLPGGTDKPRTESQPPAALSRDTAP